MIIRLINEKLYSLLGVLRNIFILFKLKIIKIFHPNILRYKSNIVEIKNNGNVLKKAKKYYREGDYSYDPKFLICREKAFLEVLNGIVTPKLVNYGPDWIEMEYAGKQISKNNLPSDWEYQINNISSILSKYDIIHRDIKLENILVKDKKIILIDFGSSVYKNEDYFFIPREVTEPKELIYDNFYALNFYIGSLL
tara:strand:+ start:3634 stop:4218 length:585 start_codon:yes stop_codon:yes gene_type:complete